jgi:putative tricarboxylic transport membrane protein
LLAGFDFLVAVIGLFGIGEILLTLEEGLAFKGASAKLNMKVVLETWSELPKYWLTSIRSSAVGCFMGIVPGGATPASFMSYGVARRFSPDGAKFGTGQVEGVVAPETAAHAAGDLGAAADADARRSRLADRGRAARRLADLGPAAGAAAVRRAERLRLGLIASMYLGNIAG